MPFAIVIAPALIVAWLAGWWLYRQAPQHATGRRRRAIRSRCCPALDFPCSSSRSPRSPRAGPGAVRRAGDCGPPAAHGQSWTSMRRSSPPADLPPEAIGAPLAALALGGTILANMAVKLGVTLAYARGKGAVGGAGACWRAWRRWRRARSRWRGCGCEVRCHHAATAVPRTCLISGDPYGNRTRVSAVKGPRPNR